MANSFEVIIDVVHVYYRLLPKIFKKTVEITHQIKVV